MNDAFRTGIADHARLADWLGSQVELLNDISERCIHALADGHRIFTLGNGGSAADAQHIAAELVGRFKCQRRALPAVALTTDTSALSSIGNDYGFEQIFARQIEALASPGDVVWVLSTSGNSPNILTAAETARSLNVTVVGFTGRSGGKLKDRCDLCFCVDHESSDRIQEIHQIAYHLICEAIERHFVEM